MRDDRQFNLQKLLISTKRKTTRSYILRNINIRMFLQVMTLISSFESVYKLNMVKETQMQLKPFRLIFIYVNEQPV
jgi:hypothetical protein